MQVVLIKRKKMNLSQSKRAQQAMCLFKEGYNCAQSSFLAFNDLLPISFQDASHLSASFGAGMGRLREVCGGLSGIFMVAGLLYGYDPNDKEKKIEHYIRIQNLSEQFKANTSCNSFICRDLLGLDIEGADSPIPRDRDEQYYSERPCERLVGIGAAIMEKYMQEHPIPQK